MSPPHTKKAFFWGRGSVPSNLFFNFGDTTMIQNMKIIKSKFRIDLKYFSQHLVNTSRVNEKWNLRILEKVQKMHFFEDIKLSNLFKSKPVRIFQWTICSQEFCSNLNGAFQVLTSFFGRKHEFFISNVLYTKFPKRRRIWDMSRTEKNFSPLWKNGIKWRESIEFTIKKSPNWDKISVLTTHIKIIWHQGGQVT